MNRPGLLTFLLAFSLAVCPAGMAGASSPSDGSDHAGMASVAGVSASVDIERVSVAERRDGKGYVLRIHTLARVKAFSEARQLGSRRYELTIFNASLAPGFKRGELETPLADYDLIQHEQHLLFRFSLAFPFNVKVYRDGASNDLLVALERTAGSEPIVQQQAPTESEGPTNAARKRWELDTIVIDAGHGGKDPGTQGYGVREKDVTLQVSKELGRLLREELGVHVIYTRTDDRFVDLADRGKIANEAGGKLFISIHANAVRRGSSVAGTETYFLGLHKSQAARDVMERENAVVRLEEQASRYAGFTNEALIRHVLAQGAYMRQSEEMAAAIDRQFVGAGRKSRGVKQAGFKVLWVASMPAVLVELGFLTNRKESSYLGSVSGQYQMARSIFEAVREFKVRYERELNLVSSSR